ncbi:zinc finger protein 184 [Drosophila ficusphila]|uniref:zinc finger protein 184 n=1 Tax=Drosophila ficusphila TaxID=30025 RepID=UPI001C89F850|nr:zinc finger protein 184 [Drosophila ficusphila]
MMSFLAKKESGNKEATFWRRWCRLCAKDNPSNQNVFAREENKNSRANMLAMTIGKYFWVDIKQEDELSNYLCSECFTLLDCLIEFSERVRKVQTLFNKLQIIKPGVIVDYEEQRRVCGLVTDDWKHMMSRAEDRHPLQRDEEVAVDKMQTAGNEKQNLIVPSLEEESFSKQNENDLQVAEEELEIVEEELQIAREELHIAGVEEQILEVDEQLVEEEVEPVEVEVEPHESSDSLVEEDHTQDDNYIEESQIIEESQVEDFEIETYEVISQDPQAETLKPKIAEESIESESDPQDDLSAGHLIEEEGEIPEEPAIYKCRICNKPYKKPKAYKRHMEEVHNTVAKDLPQLECNQCGLCFSAVNQLHAHYRTHLPPKVKPDNSCPHCEKRFTTPGTLKRHIDAVHKQIKPYICDICGKSFNYVTGLKDHKLVHTEECPFECSVCQRRFKNKARLNIHLDTHSDKGYDCTICGVKLKTRRTFNKHKLVHSDERQYKCDVCGSTFKRSKTLKSHLILHTGIRPYKCNFCGREFSNGSNCRSHKRQAHPKELAEEEARGVSRSTLLPMLEELTKASKLIKTPAKSSKTRGSRQNVFPKKARKCN